MSRIENVLIGIHIGAPAKLSCRRDGRRYTGNRGAPRPIGRHPREHADRWEMHDETTGRAADPASVGASLASQANPGWTRHEWKFATDSVRDAELEGLGWRDEARDEFALRVGAALSHEGHHARGGFASRGAAQLGGGRAERSSEVWPDDG